MKNMLKEFLKENNALPINKTTLAEMNVIALSCPPDLIADLTYVETQQVLTLWSLTQYMNERGLEAPVSLQIGDA